MSFIKDQYISEVERLMDERGLTYEQASELAYESMRDRFADMADAMKDRRKERQP